jgi:hypothetical protein
MCKLPKCFTDEFENLPAEVDRLIYVRDEARKRIGVILINNGACGWSLCNDTDEWDTFSGILTAWERLVEGKSISHCAVEVWDFNMKFNLNSFMSGLKTAQLFFILRDMVEN